MKVYRIVQDETRTSDLSGTGAFRTGGRWNSKGTYMLYTSENSSLALLEICMHFDNGDMPPELFMMQIDISNDSLIHTLPDAQYTKNWLTLSFLENQIQGNAWMTQKKWLGIRVKSAVNPGEHNILLNPLYPGYNSLVKVTALSKIPIDERLVQLVNKL